MIDISALEVPAEADWLDDAVGEAGAGIGVDLRPLNPVVRPHREEHLERVEPAEQLLRGDVHEAGPEHRGIEIRGRRESIAIPVLHFVGRVEVKEWRHHVAAWGSL